MKSFLKCSNLLVLLILCITAEAGYGYDIKIGVLASSGPEKCQKTWNPTANYLSEKLSEYTFTIVPLSFDNISAAVRNEEIDFLLANPFIYRDFAVKYGISRIATLKTKLSDNYPLFGGVIFTRSDNHQIYKLRDLAGKKFVAVAPASLGGWLAALRELKKGEIDPYKDFAGLQFTGNHESAIYAVLQGKADAGTANTNEFADLIRRGKIKRRDFRVIVPEWIGISKEFPYPVSTRLYPDWSFAKLSRTPEDLATKVAIALLSMSSNYEAARAANCYGWSYPLNYQSVDELSKELRLGGYRDFGEMSIRDILYKYKTAFILVFIIFVVLLILSVLLEHLYRRTKRSEESLFKSEKKLKDITSSLAEGIYVLSEQGHIIFMNPEAEHLLGWTFTELSGKSVHDIVHCRKADGPPLSLEECSIYNVIRTGIPFVSGGEFFTRKDGTIFPISIVASPIMENGKAVASVVSFRDITVQKQLEEELLRAKKLESVGILAGGIAHDYNNLLQGIVGYIGLAKAYVKDEKLYQMLDRVEKASNGAGELSFRLLTFSTGGDPVRTPIDVSKLVKETAHLSSCSLNVSCQFDLPDNLHPVNGDEGQLYQVIRNISINAREAMPDGGKLTYTAENVTVGEDSNLSLSKGEYVRISISDTGTGIAGEHMAKIFDPYFTTKEMGSEKGTGLGLSICYSIIKKHKGLITVESRMGTGTTFHIYLPAQYGEKA